MCVSTVRSTKYNLVSFSITEVLFVKSYSPYGNEELIALQLDLKDKTVNLYEKLIKGMHVAIARRDACGDGSRMKLLAIPPYLSTSFLKKISRSHLTLFIHLIDHSTISPSRQNYFFLENYYTTNLNFTNVVILINANINH